MEVIEILENLITNMGFPIACCIVLFKQNAKFVDAINTNSEALKNLIEKVDELNDNK